MTTVPKPRSWEVKLYDEKKIWHLLIMIVVLCGLIQKILFKSKMVQPGIEPAWAARQTYVKTTRLRGYLGDVVKAIARNMYVYNASHDCWHLIC